MNVIWTDKGKTSYLKLLIFLKETHGQNTILKLSNDVQRCISRIISLPELYPIINKERQIRRCVLSKNSSLAYRYDKEL